VARNGETEIFERRFSLAESQLRKSEGLTYDGRLTPNGILTMQELDSRIMFLPPIFLPRVLQATAGTSNLALVRSLSQSKIET
jgi:hypothetical protein